MLAYNIYLKRDLSARTSEHLRLCVEQVSATADRPVTVRIWRLDEDHGNWWKAWQADFRARGMGIHSFAPRFGIPEGGPVSPYTLALPTYLRDPADVAFWKSREAAYQEAGQLRCEEKQITPAGDGRLILQTRLLPYGVALLEILDVEPASAH